MVDQRISSAAAASRRPDMILRRVMKGSVLAALMVVVWTATTIAGLDDRFVAQAGLAGATKGRVEFGQEFKLRNGEAIHVGDEGLMLRFERVTRDDRCPIGDPCVSAVGDAIVLVTVQQPPNEAAGLELHTHPRATSGGQYLRHRIRLVRLEPRPVGEQPVPLPQYWATFVVSRRG